MFPTTMPVSSELLNNMTHDRKIVETNACNEISNYCLYIPDFNPRLAEFFQDVRG